jgi:hypothetical protein
MKKIIVLLFIVLILSSCVREPIVSFVDIEIDGYSRAYFVTDRSATQPNDMEKFLTLFVIETDDVIKFGKYDYVILRK